MEQKLFLSGIVNKFLVVALFFVVIISGCIDNVTPTADDSGVTPEGINSVVDANNQFAFDMYLEFKEKEGNIFFSPYSISTALTMTYEGAKGTTAEEMQTVLHIPENPEIRRPAFASIYNEINKKDKKYMLSTNTVERYYGGKITNLDFISESEKSRQIINTWIEDNTNNKIKNLIPPGVLNTNTRMVLTNAIYFKGNWVKQFDIKNTREEDFKTSSGNNVRASMMSLTEKDTKFNYAETDNLQVLEMPYVGEEVSMLVFLPKEDNLSALEESLNFEKISELKGTLKEQQIKVYFPKFKFEIKSTLNEPLRNLGMISAFNNADFSGMDGTKDLQISAVIHQAFVEVNEEGTEAAAATGVVMGTTSIGPRIPIFRADHPFVFLIQERKSGNILFMGRVSDPTV